MGQSELETLDVWEFSLSLSDDLDNDVKNGQRYLKHRRTPRI